MSGLILDCPPAGTANVTVSVPATNTPQTYSLPKQAGKLAAFGAPAAKTATGTAVEFINGDGDVVIPDDARRITLSMSAVSYNAATFPRIQIGTSGGFDVTGYEGAGSVVSSGAASANHSAGFDIYDASVTAAYEWHGQLTLVRMTGNLWSISGAAAPAASARQTICSGTKLLSGTLDRIRVVPANGTASYDNGTLSILVE